MSLNPSDFTDEKFDPDQWINSIISRATPLEQLHSELQRYITSQKTQLADFLNKNYAGFLALPSSLQGTLASIQFVQDNLALLRDRTTHTIRSVENTLSQVKQCTQLQNQARDTEQALMAMEEACQCATELFDAIDAYSVLPPQLAKVLHVQMRSRAMQDGQHDLLEFYTQMEHELAQRSTRTLSAMSDRLSSEYTTRIQLVFPSQVGIGDFQRDVVKYQRDLQQLSRTADLDPRYLLCSPAFARIFAFAVGAEDAQIRLQRIRDSLMPQNDLSSSESRSDSSLAQELLTSCSILSEGRRLEFVAALEMAIKQQSGCANQRAEASAEISPKVLTCLQSAALHTYAREAMLPTEGLMLQNLLSNLTDKINPTAAGADSLSERDDLRDDADNIPSLEDEVFLAVSSPNPKAISTKLNKNRSESLRSAHDEDLWYEPTQDELLSSKHVRSNPFLVSKLRPEDLEAGRSSANERKKIDLQLLVDAANWHRQQAGWTHELEVAIASSHVSTSAALQNSSTDCFTRLILSTPLVVRQLTRMSLLLRKSVLDGAGFSDKGLLVPLTSEVSSEVGSTPLVDALTSLHTVMEEAFVDQISSLLLRICRFAGSITLSSMMHTSCQTLSITLFEALHALDRSLFTTAMFRELLVRPALADISSRNAIISAATPPSNSELLQPPLYASLLARLKGNLAFACEIFSHSGTQNSPYALSFIGDCFWPEVVAMLQQPQSAALFAAVPETFAPALTNFLVFYSSVCDLVLTVHPTLVKKVLDTLDMQTKSVLTKWSVTTYTRLLQIQVQTAFATKSHNQPLQPLAVPYICDSKQSVHQPSLPEPTELSSETVCPSMPPFQLQLRISAQAIHMLLYIWSHNVIIPQTLATNLERTMEIGNILASELELGAKSLRFLSNAMNSAQLLTSQSAELNEVINWKPLNLSELLRRISQFTQQSQTGKTHTDDSDKTRCSLSVSPERAVALHAEKINPALTLLADVSTLMSLMSDSTDKRNLLIDYIASRLENPRFIKSCIALSHSQTAAQAIVQRTLMTLQDVLAKTIAYEKLRPIQNHLIIVIAAYVASEGLAAADPGIKAIKSEFLAGDRNPEAPSGYLSCLIAPFHDLQYLLQRCQGHRLLAAAMESVIIASVSAFIAYVIPEIKRQMSTVLATTSAAHASLLRIKAASGASHVSGMSTEDKVQKQVWIDVKALSHQLDSAISNILLQSSDSVRRDAKMKLDVGLKDLVTTIAEAVRDELK